jgi:alpha-N-acetylglucosamine transferase
VLNPEYTGMLTKVLFIDIDTFVIRNLDEVFCAPRRAGR